MSWGIKKWGLTPWGLGDAGGDLTVVDAVAVATEIVRVTLSREPKNISPNDAGDVYNTSSWAITRADTGAAFTVIAVQEFDPPYVWDVIVYEKFGSHLVTHTITANGLVATNGEPVEDPTSATFAGLLSAVLREEEFELRDLANPPAPSETGVSGTLKVGADGDYVNVEGVDLVKKLILRRLVTKPGEFFHLPDYGIGLTVKEPLPIGDLIKLKAEIERQIIREPEVAAVSAQLSMDANNILTVLLKTQLRPTGQKIDIPFQAGPEGVVAL